MNNEFSFTEFGLGVRDKRVYEALIDQPHASVRQISTATAINRGSVYESIKHLVAVGLVGSIQKGKQQRYIAQDPSVIIELLKERQQLAKQAETLATRYIESLATRHMISTEPASFAIYYEGDEGVAAILRDVLKSMRSASPRRYYVISSKQVRHYLYSNFPNFTRQRIKEGVEARVIAIGAGGGKDQLADRRWLSTKDSNLVNCYTIIYGDKTAFISMNEQHVLTGIVIENQGVANVQKEQFNRIWDTLA